MPAHPARGLPLALGYLTGLLAGTLLLDSRPPAVRDHWLDWASTNMANLGDHPIGALLASAFLATEHLLAWAMLAAAGLLSAGRVLGSWRTLSVVVSAHVIGTVISEGIVAIRVGAGQLPDAARHQQDVGPSFVVVAALVAAIAIGTWWGRLLGVLGFAVLAPSLFSGLTELDVAAVGHCCAIVVGAGLAWLLSRQVLPEPPEAAGPRALPS